MKGRQISISKRSLISFFVFLVCIEPPIFKKLPNLFLIDIIFEICILVCSLYCIIDFFTKGRIPNRRLYSIMPLLGVFFFQILSTVFHNGIIVTSIVTSLEVVTPCMWMLRNEDDLYPVICALRFYLYILVSVNFISIMLFPNGIFITTNMWNRTDPQWILSLGNSMAPYILTTSLLSTLSFIEFKARKAKIFDLLILLMCIATPILVDSATLLGGMFLFIILFLIIEIKKDFLKYFNINIYVTAATVVCLLLLVFRRIDFFSYVIENILHRNLTLTGRLGIWDRSIAAIKDKAILGYGVLDIGEVQRMLLASHQHNLYLHILFQGGLLSFGMFIVLLNKCRCQLIHVGGKKSVLISICIFCYLIIFISETYGEGTYIIPFYLVIFMGLLVDKMNSAETRSNNVFRNNAIL